MSANFYLSGNPVHDRIIRAMYDGCPEISQLCDMIYEPADYACVFGVLKSKIPVSWPRGQVIKKQESAGKPVIICETGYLNRGDFESNHYAVGLGGLNGRADFKNEGSPPDRFQKLRIDVKDWRKSGSHILVCEQVPWDASVDHLDYHKWLDQTVNSLKLHTDREIRVRPHPAIQSNKKSFQEDIKDCWAVVTLNSNAAVEAAIAGIPIFAYDGGSMAWGIANKRLELIENPIMPPREQWLNNLAYTQWTPAEMREGLAWEHLFA